MNIQQMLRQMQGGMGQGMPPPDSPIVDTAEQVYISSLALLKMLKHGLSGPPQTCATVGGVDFFSFLLLQAVLVSQWK